MLRLEGCQIRPGTNSHQPHASALFLDYIKNLIRLPEGKVLTAKRGRGRERKGEDGLTRNEASSLSQLVWAAVAAEGSLLPRPGDALGLQRGLLPKASTAQPGSSKWHMSSLWFPDGTGREGSGCREGTWGRSALSLHNTKCAAESPTARLTHGGHTQDWVRGSRKCWMECRIYSGIYIIYNL